MKEKKETQKKKQMKTKKPEEIIDDKIVRDVQKKMECLNEKACIDIARVITNVDDKKDIRKNLIDHYEDEEWLLDIKGSVIDELVKKPDVLEKIWLDGHST